VPDPDEIIGTDDGSLRALLRHVEDLVKTSIGLTLDSLGAGETGLQELQLLMRKFKSVSVRDLEHALWREVGKAYSLDYATHVYTSEVEKNSKATIDHKAIANTVMLVIIKLIETSVDVDKVLRDMGLREGD